ncbi:hypothetical protein AKJ37_07295 [candidate division MSBL1 archaeon SCGC-AAA259I09]|uniref:DUF4394 domain-containing protein n=1 Tax=candidate division MSBL1 archaeon SCGC-AAA259I09 TaxID=1698267 RepID=A0A133UL13_9EURY|nr:hypothetical protein AKJ37_07295 [candidate division MSBL1 archaeon SCGC-AAA259I09]
MLEFNIGFRAIQQRHLECKLYGISAVGMDLYGIFPTEGRLEPLYFDDSDTYKNGLAYDPIFDRLYYAQGQGSPDLMYYDFATDSIVDTNVDLSGTTYAATCKGGDYYFILDGDDALQMVPFDMDTGFGGVEVLVSNITGDDRTFAMGDMDFTQDGKILVGASRDGDGSVLFNYDMDADTYEESIVTLGTEIWWLQVSFCHNGTLWAVRHDTADWYTVTNPLDPTNAALVSAGTLGVGGEGFMDVAAVHPCTNR